jgi:hypothetical protein
MSLTLLQAFTIDTDANTIIDRTCNQFQAAWVLVPIPAVIYVRPGFSYPTGAVVPWCVMTSAGETEKRFIRKCHTTTDSLYTRTSPPLFWPKALKVINQKSSVFSCIMVRRKLELNERTHPSPDQSRGAFSYKKWTY